MPFKWDVQPYQFINELRLNYTETVINVARSKALELAPEIESWMKDNAPWKDTDVFGPVVFGPLRKGADEKRRREIIFPAGNARKRLRAFVSYSAEEDRAWGRIPTQVQQTLDRKMAAMNRRFASSGSTKRIVRFGDAAVEKMTAKFEQQFRGEFPILKIVMDYGNSADRRVPYAVWLEIAKGGRYSIIGPAMDYWGGKALRQLTSLGNLVQYQGRGLDAPPPTEQEKFAETVRDYEEGFLEPYQPWTKERQENARYQKYRRKQRALGNYGRKKKG